jgi:hypothetical protein
MSAAPTARDGGFDMAKGIAIGKIDKGEKMKNIFLLSVLLLPNVAFANYALNMMDIATGQPVGTNVRQMHESAVITRNIQELDRKDREQVAWALAWRANASDDPQERDRLARAIQMQLPHLTGLDADTTIFAIVGPEYYRTPANAIRK